MLNSFIEPYGWGWKKYTPPSSSSSFRISPTLIRAGSTDFGMGGDLRGGGTMVRWGGISA